MRVVLLVTLFLALVVSTYALTYSQVEELNRLERLNRMERFNRQNQWADIDDFEQQDMDFDENTNDYYNTEDDFDVNGQANLGMNLGLGLGLGGMGLDQQQYGFSQQQNWNNINMNQQQMFQDQDLDQFDLKQQQVQQQVQFVRPQKLRYTTDVQQPNWLQQNKAVKYQQPIVTYAQPIVQKMDLSLPNIKKQHQLAQAIIQPTYQTAPVQQAVSLSATAPVINKGFGSNTRSRFQNY
jgi:hypothetical protein